MSLCRSIIVLSLASAPALAYAQSGAQSGTFQVGATVLPRAQATQAPLDFPAPSQARQLTSHPFGSSWFVHGDMRATATWYRVEMAHRGWRMLADASSGQVLRQHWQRGDERVEIRLQPVLGTRPASRMIVIANYERRVFPKR